MYKNNSALTFHLDRDIPRRNLGENRAYAVHGNMEIIVTVNDLRFMEKRKNTNFPKLSKVPLVVSYQKKDSDKVEKQRTRWRKCLTGKKNSAIL